MSWHNPPMPWPELERRLSGRFTEDELNPGERDDPAPSRHHPRAERERPAARPPAPHPYAELHCHSNFSFLDGASHPEELVAEAARLGLEAVAITDHDGLYGAVRFAEAAAAAGLRTVFGAELSLGLTQPGGGVPDPEGQHLLVLANGPEGYRRLSSAITEAHLAG
ncbi:PHP domain-containing protein, partial [Actinoalloteichus spitiensis]|uniref:PHP domain-containing protein n=1 Tax=Actinoalloteichus spitiensis TaxID=252394 RepID=UPI000378E78E